MAQNPNINKVEFGNDVLMDITDTTAEPEDVAEGKVFYRKSGARAIGTLVTGRRTRRDITNDMANLSTAIAEQNLAKYGYAIGDYFVGPTNVGTSASPLYMVYTLADMDTYYGGYTSYAVVNTHHIAIVVDTKLTSAWLGSGSLTGYKASTLHTFLTGSSVLAKIKQDLAALTGDAWSAHMIAHDKLYSTYANSAFSWAWSSTDTHTEYISALTEMDIYGAPVWSGNPYQQGEAIKQLEVFRKFRFNEIFGNSWKWLRSMYSASGACYANYGGNARYYSISSAGGVVGLILYK